MTPQAPGTWRPLVDRWGRFESLCAELPPGACVIVDRRVAKLHPHVLRAVEARSPALVVPLQAGEPIKQLSVAEEVLAKAVRVPRGATVLAIGGGTIGDLAAVIAHLHKRGARLVQVPTTLLAAVDSSVGGKGAVDVRGVKNAVGVFHYADESWLCSELFETLTEAQHREGEIEAWKMAVCLDPRAWRTWTSGPFERSELVRSARRIKARVCEEDPYEQSGLRRVLNFGHTFGHALESLSAFRLRHGEAVGIGMLCALDVGRELGVTPAALASRVEQALTDGGPVRNGRSRLAKLLQGTSLNALQKVLQSDKKAIRSDALTMILLERIGRAPAVQVPHEVWRKLLPVWHAGDRP